MHQLGSAREHDCEESGVFRAFSPRIFSRFSFRDIHESEDGKFWMKISLTDDWFRRGLFAAFGCRRTSAAQCAHTRHTLTCRCRVSEQRRARTGTETERGANTCWKPIDVAQVGRAVDGCEWSRSVAGRPSGPGETGEAVRRDDTGLTMGII